MKKLLKFLLLILILLIVALAVLPMVAGGWIRSQAESAIAEGMDAEVSFQKFDFGWLSGLEFTDLKIDGRKPESPDFEIESFRAKPALFALLGKKLVIDDARAKGVVVRSRAAAPKAAPSSGDEPPKTEPAPQGESPSDEDETAQGTELPLDLDVAMVIEDLTLIHEDPSWPAAFAIRSFERVEARIRTGEKLEFAVKDGPLALDGDVDLFEGRRLRPSDEITADAHLRASSLDLKRYAEAIAPWFKVEGGQLAADQRFSWRDGRVGLVGSTNLNDLALEAADGSIRHRVQSLELKADLKTKPDLEGQGTLTLAVRGARASGVEGVEGPLDLGSVDLDTELSSGRVLRVKTAQVKGDLMQLTAGGELVFGDALPKGDFNLKLDTALDKLARFVGGRKDLGGALHSDFALKTNADGGVSVRGGTTVKNLRASAGENGPTINEREVVLRHDLDYDENRLDLKDIRLDASFAKAKAGGRLDLGGDGVEPTGTINLDGEADLERVVALFGDLIPADLKGRVNISSQIRAVTGGTDFNAKVGTQGLVVKTEALGKEPFDVGRLTGEFAGSMRDNPGQFELSRLKLQGDLADLEGRMRQALPETGDGDLSVVLGGRVDLDRLAAPFLDARPRSALARSQINLDVLKRGDRVELKKAELVAGQTRAQATGTMQLGENATTSIDYDFKGQLEDLSPYLATLEEPMQGRGRIEAAGRLEQGPRSAMTAKGTLRQLSLSGPGAGDRDVSIAQGDFDIATHGGGEATLALDKLVMNLKGFRQAKKDSAALAGDLKLNGGLNPNGQFNFRLDGTKLEVTPTDAAPVRLSKPLAFIAKGRLNEAAGIYDIDDLSVSADGIEARGQGSWLPSKRFKVKTSANLENAAFARTWLSSFFDDVEGQGQGRLELDADLPLGKEADGATAQGSLLATMDSLTLEGFTLTQLDLKGNLVDGLGSLEKGDALLNGGPAKLKLNLDLRPEEPLVDFGINAQNVKVVKRMQPSIARVIPIFAGVGAEVETSLNINLDVNGRGSAMDSILQTLTGGGDFSAAAGSVRGGPVITALMGALGAPGRIDFNTLTTKIQVKDGAVIQDGLNIDGSVVDLRLSGRTFFDGRLDYALGVKPEPGKVKEWDRFAPLVAGDGFLPLGLIGTVASPSAKLPDPGKLLEGAAKNALGGALNGLLGGKKEDGEKPKNPLESLLGGGKKKEEGQSEKPRNPLESLLGGKKKDEGEDGEKKKKKSPLEKLLGGGKEH
jgi:AsmA-like C-terminal region